MAGINASAPQDNSFAKFFEILENKDASESDNADFESLKPLTTLPEIEALRFRQTPQKIKMLEENIDKHGCLDSIKVWEGHYIKGQAVIIDGKLRYDICHRLGIPYEVHPMHFDTLEDVQNWVVAEQLSKRNLTKFQQAYLIGVRYNTEKKSHGGDRKSSDQSDHMKTSLRLASMFNVAEATVRRAGTFAEAVDSLNKDIGQEFKEKILNEDFKRLYQRDIKKLDDKPLEEKKAIAVQLESDPELSLSEAEDIVQPQKEPATTKGQVTSVESAVQRNSEKSTGETGQTVAGEDTSKSIGANIQVTTGTEKTDNPDKLLEEFKRRQEANYQLLLGIERVSNIIKIPNMQKMAREIFDKLKEIEAASSSS
jgi:hypothetical protein